MKKAGVPALMFLIVTENKDCHAELVEALITFLSLRQAQTDNFILISMSISAIPTFEPCLVQPKGI